jgi:Fe-S-cluster formation regulator IscX/YfhJ
MPTPEVKPAPLRDTNYQNKIIELIEFDKEKQI